MSNIVVTVPKTRLAYVQDVKFKLQPGDFGFWTLSRLPRLTKEKWEGGVLEYRDCERLYFVWDGAVRAWHQIMGWVDEDGTVEDGPPFYHGGQIPGPAVLFTAEHHLLESPIPMKGFQGFRYAKFDEESA